MDDKKVETTMLVLTDEADELYAIPQEALEQYRVTEEQKAALEQEWGEEVSGYSMYQNFLSQQTSAYDQAELRRRGEEIRHKANHAQMTTTSDQQDEVGIQVAEVEPRGMKKLFTGVLTTLRLAPVRITKEP
jgi:hypothetical protein